MRTACQKLYALLRVCLGAWALARERESAYQGHCAYSIPQVWIPITYLIQYWLHIGRRPGWPVYVRVLSIQANEPTVSPILGVRSAELQAHSFDSLTSTCLCYMHNWRLHLAAGCVYERAAMTSGHHSAMLLFRNASIIGQDETFEGSGAKTYVYMYI